MRPVSEEGIEMAFHNGVKIGLLTSRLYIHKVVFECDHRNVTRIDHHIDPLHRGIMVVVASLFNRERLKEMRYTELSFRRRHFAKMRFKASGYIGEVG